MKHKVPRILLIRFSSLSNSLTLKQIPCSTHEQWPPRRALCFVHTIKVEKLDSHNYKANLHAAFSIGPEEVESIVLEESVKIKTTLNF
ncbi:hypothetical protein VCV18_001275 [Metarhizium anisopliae]